MPIEPGWYLELYDGEAKNPEYDSWNYSRVIGLYLVEIQWPNETISQDVVPVTSFLTHIDMSDLELWRDHERDGYKTSGNLVYFPDESSQEFYKEKKAKR